MSNTWIAKHDHNSSSIWYELAVSSLSSEYGLHNIKFQGLAGRGLVRWSLPTLPWSFYVCWVTSDILLSCGSLFCCWSIISCWSLSFYNPHHLTIPSHPYSSPWPSISISCPSPIKGTGAVCPYLTVQLSTCLTTRPFSWRWLSIAGGGCTLPMVGVVIFWIF